MVPTMYASWSFPSKKSFFKCVFLFYLHNRGMFSYFYITPVKKERRYCMKVNDLSFGSITIDGITYIKDVVIEDGTVHKRQKK